MAARRLLIVLVLLLVASIVAASLAPERRSQLATEDSSTTTTTAPAEPFELPGDVIETRIDASTKEPETVRASPGDQLRLAVGVPAEPGRTIAIEDFGVTEFAAPRAPAHFDLLLRDAGTFAITDEREKVVGRLVVAEGGGGGNAKGGDAKGGQPEGGAAGGRKGDGGG